MEPISPSENGEEARPASRAEDRPPEISSAAERDRLTALALAYFEAFASGGGRPLFKEFGQANNVDPRTAGEQVARAIGAGLVRIVAAEDVRRARVSSLEQRLKQLFPELEAAIVVHVAAKTSDERHKQVAETLGWEVAHATFPVFHASMRLGVGSGRGVGCLVDYMRGREDSFALADVTLLAMTGRVFSLDEAEKTFDADSHVSGLGDVMGSDNRVRRIGRPIAFDAKQSSDTERFKVSQLWLSGEENFAVNAPHMAIFGVGVLDRGHRFVKIVDKFGKRVGPTQFPKGFYTDLCKLVDLVEAVERDQSGYWCCGDICNRLFVVPWPPGTSDQVKSTVRDKVAPLVLSLNARLLTVTKTQLQRHNVRGFCIASGKAKARAIWHILTHKPGLKHRSIDERPGLVNTLAIDVECAEGILDQTEAPDWPEFAQSQAEANWRE